MPCRDEYIYIEGPRTIYVQDPELEDAFCSACTALEENKIDIPPAAKSMWAKHKAKDKARREKARKDLEREKLRKSALAKLTKAERDILGLR